MSVFKKAALFAAGSFCVASSASAGNYKVVPGELIVKFKSHLPKKLKSDVLKQLGVTLDRKILKSDDSLYVIKTDQEMNLKALESALINNENVEYAEPNYIYSVSPVKHNVDKLIPNFKRHSQNYSPLDPKFGALWGLDNTGSNPGTANGVQGADIDALKAWTMTLGARAVKIAVIDTGIDYTHPDLVDQMWVNTAERDGKAGVDDDGNGYVDDVYGYDFAGDDGDPKDGHSHGTHCAGTIGATHDDVGVAGVMSNVQFVAVKFLSDSGSGTTENAIKAIDYATSLDVDIMSNSWGGGGFSQALKDAIQRASDKGIIFTAAAGNSSTNNDQRPHYPSNYDVPNVVSVAATTAADTMASFSCYGRNTVHIGAPGHKILSTVKDGGYDTYSGTSMATPHVSGALGLLVAQEGRMDHAEMRERLMATSEPVRALRGKTISGGRLNAYNLLTDTRPERNEPNPDNWQTISLDEAFESNHPYGNNESFSKSFSAAGAKFMRVIVKKYTTEARYDFVKVKNSDGAVAESISGSGENYVSEYIEGDSLTVEFVSDRSNNGWGFSIEEIQVQY